MVNARALVIAVFLSATGQALAQQQDPPPELSQREAEDAARSVAKFCKVLVERMDDLIDDQWATQDLGDLASVWESLACHDIFGIDERIRWLLR